MTDFTQSSYFLRHTHILVLLSVWGQPFYLSELHCIVCYCFYFIFFRLRSSPVLGHIYLWLNLYFLFSHGGLFYFSLSDWTQQRSKFQRFCLIKYLYFVKFSPVEKMDQSWRYLFRFLCLPDDVTPSVSASCSPAGSDLRVLIRRISHPIICALNPYNEPLMSQLPPDLRFSFALTTYSNTAGCMFSSRIQISHRHGLFLSFIFFMFVLLLLFMSLFTPVQSEARLFGFSWLL